jgi:hydrophobic/amphiphilic exporter-1 (mainly G- bacteria), HAE1 family
MKIIDNSIKRRVTIAMFTVAVVMFGFVSFSRLKLNLLPELNYPTLTIRTEYTGAAPAEVENLISKPIEETIGTVKNVRTVSSISRTGQSDVLLEFAWGTDMDLATIDVREKMDSLELPLEASRPIILRFDPSLDPIIRLGFYRDTAAPSPSPTLDEDGLKYLRRFADEQIKKELESAMGVAAAKVSGGLEDEIQVLVDQEKLAQLNIPVESIGQILGAENVNLSGGRLEEGTRQFLVRTLNQFRSIEEIGNVVITSVNDGRGGKTPVFLRDIASVRHSYKERMSIIRQEGREAVEIAIYKEGDANTVAVGREIDNRLRQIRKSLPPGYKLIKIYDQSTFINNAVQEVIDAAIIGGLLAVLILYFFLRNFWATMIIALSIPISVITTFNLMYGSDLTLNIMSLGGIALGIGMLVDNSIVVLENISRHKKMGKNAADAARTGAGEVGGAVIASTLTTIAVFFPLVFVKGVAGQLFSDQALTITFALVASLVVALTLIPMLSSLHGRKNDDDTSHDSAQTAGALQKPVPKSFILRIFYYLGRGIRAVRVFLFTTLTTFIISIILRIIRLISKGVLFLMNPIINVFMNVYNRVEKRYPDTLKWSLNHKGTVLGIAALLFALSLLLIPQLGVELIPQLSQGEFRVEFRLPPGTPLEKTDAVMTGVQLATSKMKRISTAFSVAGSGSRMDANPEQGGENWGEMSVIMSPGSERLDEQIAMDDIREITEHLPGLKYKFYRPTLFTFKTPVEVEIAGFNLDKLRNVSNAIAAKMSASPRFADVKSTMEQGYPEIRIRFNREKAAQLGLPVYVIADRIVNKVRGNVATRYSWHDRKIDVLVRASEKDRTSAAKIRKLIINPESSRPVTLDAVADITVATGPSEIRRIGQERVALVTANTNFGDLGTAASEIENIISTVNLPDDMRALVAGQNEEMAVSFQSLRFALLLAIFLVYLVMASQFESFIHPLVIIFTIPLALIGAVLALWITNSTLSVVVFIGLILLAGIVVNNAIVLIDLINQLRAKGSSKVDAILEAGRSRLRPIVMTMLTTTLGLLPMAIGLGEGAEVRAPMAITVIGGLTVSTLLTLVVIPVVYSVMDRNG